MLTVQVFGPIKLTGAEGPVEVHGRALEIVAFLATRWDHSATDEELLDTFWPMPDDPAALVAVRPEGAMHTAISRLNTQFRKATGHGGVTRSGLGYALGHGLQLVVDATDVRAIIRSSFQALLTQDEWEWAGRVLMARDRGPALSGCPGDWVTATSQRLESDFVAATNTWARAGIALDQPVAVADGLTELLRHPAVSQDRTVRELLARARLTAGRLSAARSAMDELRALSRSFDIALSPEQLRLEDEIFEREESAFAGTRPLTSKPPPRDMTSFIGRDRELAQVQRHVEDHQLVTLIGMGGVGKTRLVIEAVNRMVGTKAWVPLADVDGDSVWVETGRALGLLTEDSEAILDHLRTWKGLIVLDNCEHVIGIVVMMTEAIGRRCPFVHILATSRTPLDLKHEHLFHVPPLQVPTSCDPDSIYGSDAVGLLVERIRKTGAPVEFDAPLAGLVSGICRALDGIPLAIELAAASVTEDPSLRDLAAQIERGDNTRLGSTLNDFPARHRSLTETLNWSIDLLHPVDRAVFPLFRGPMDAAALAALLDVNVDRSVATDVASVGQLVPIGIGSFRLTTSGSTASTLTMTVGPAEERATLARRLASDIAHRAVTALAKASLLVPVSGGFRTLDVVRVHAETMLTEPTTTDMLQRHALHFAARASDVGRRLYTDPTVVPAIDRDLPNYRQAIATAVEAPYPPVAVALIGRLAFFWLWTGRPLEGLQWARATLEMARIRLAIAQDERRTASWIAGLEMTAGFLASVAGQLDLVERELSHAACRYSENAHMRDDQLALSDRRMMAWSLFHLARTLTIRSFAGAGERTLLAAASLGYEMALGIFRAAGHRLDEAYVLPFAAWNAWQLGADAEALVERSAELARPGIPGSEGLPWVEAVAGVNSLLIKLARGDHVGLVDGFARHARYLREVGDLYSLLITVCMLGTPPYARLPRVAPATRLPRHSTSSALTRAGSGTGSRWDWPLAS
ncbi:MAG: hypothetical protein OEX04_02810 [Acidimicrobiia bacterium]|nr:hypothetical protein [Acidimicrobiia bacterium]MDH4306384.1 hypothetical protein [Acidimicrobiia bacterium]